MAASKRGHLETTKLLLRRGALVNYQSKVRVLYVYGAHAQNGVLSLGGREGGAFCVAMCMVITLYIVWAGD